MPDIADPLTGAYLPELREDIRLVEGSASASDHSWLIYDPVRHRYFQISSAARDLLILWRPEPFADYLHRASEALGRPVSPDEVSELSSFVAVNHLVVDPSGLGPNGLARVELEAGGPLMWRAVHNYLFFKIPLFRPDPFLRRTLPLVSWLSSRTAVLAIAAASLVGLYLTSRQWDQFTGTFLEFFSLEGAFIYVLCLLLIKALHELGHAYTATRFGVRVNTMGVAFMVLTPILYTDVTDAWRLKDRHRKLAIDAAGIIVELSIAGVALFLWAFLPDGPWRSAAFVTATTSLVLGLMINLNPLMRFDGYHLLTDAWNVPNLDGRSKAMAIWWLRERLFGLGDQPPEAMPVGRRKLVILYACLAWLYRQALFIGIAIAVYHLFFKALGVLLFLIEIVWFVVLPAVGELRSWWAMRKRILAMQRSRIAGLGAAAALLIFFVPWSSSVTFQAVTTSESEFVIFAPIPGQIRENHLKDGRHIEQGAVLLELFSPDLERQLAQARLQMALTAQRLARIAGDQADLSSRVVLEGQLARNQASVTALEADIERLTVKAPFAGILRDVDHDLRIGEWIDDVSPSARLVATGQAAARGYVNEEQVWRIEVGSDAVFVPEDPLLGRYRGTVTEIEPAGSRTIEVSYLASVYGGAVPSDRSPDGEVRPRGGRNMVRVALADAHRGRVVRGTLHLTGRRESLASALWRQLLKVIIRESAA